MFLDFRERNATVAMKWAELADEERKDWARKAESVCSSPVQVSCPLVASVHIELIKLISLLGASTCSYRSARPLVLSPTESSVPVPHRGCPY